MDLQLPSLPFFLLTVLLMITLMVMKKKPSKPRTGARPPPGPWRLPFIGSMHHLTGSLPHHALRRLARKHGPVMLLRLGQADLTVISSREAARAVMKTHDFNFASRPELAITKVMTYDFTSLLFSPYGTYWRQLRKICTMELLSTRRIKSFSWLREEETSKLMRAFSASGKTPINLSERIVGLTNSIFARAAFGEQCQLTQGFMSAVKESMAISTGFSVGDTFPSLKFIDIVSGARANVMRVHHKLDGFLGEIVRQHQARAAAAAAENGNQGPRPKGGDLVDAMLWIRDHGDLEIPLTIDTIKITILDMFNGGTETSSTLAAWAMAELMKNPGVMSKAQEEVREALKEKGRVEESDLVGLNYLKLVIKETLRLHPPLPLLVPRASKESCRVEGYDIPAGSRMVVNAWALGRDPRYWEDAETFKPERFDGSPIDFRGADFMYLPFGSGRRTCPGMGFGLATVEIILANLLFYFDWELPGGMKPEELDMTENFAISAIRTADLCAVATPRFPVPTVQNTRQ